MSPFVLRATRLYKALLSCGFILLASGCASQYNLAQPKTESAILPRITQLTYGFDRAGEAYFSNDSRWIIFQATPRGEPHYQMYVAKLKWSVEGITGIEEPVRISPENSRNTCGYFSPNNNTLIFASTAGKENPAEAESGYQRQGSNYRWAYPKGMEIYRADGWETAITHSDPNRGINLAQHALTDNDAYDAECSFSNDGRWICFTSNRDGDLELYAMRAGGGQVVRLTHMKGYDGGPFFSPEGKKLVYRSDRAGNDLLQIYVSDVVYDAAGNITGLANERRLTDDQNVNWGPYWHPDGRHIVYATSRHGHTNYELYLMRADGSHKTRLTFTEGFDGLPAFSADGKWLIWSGKRSDTGKTQVFVAPFRFPYGS